MHWPLADHQGTVRDVVDSSAALVEHLTYDAFGNLLGGADPLVAFTYTGQEYDAATGLYYYDARYYDAATGRFTSEDPLGPDVDSNLYRYVRNNPVLYVDPTGKSPARPTTTSSSPSPLFWNSPLGDLGRGGLLGPSWDFEISDPRSGGGTFSGDRWASTSLDYRLDVPTQSRANAPASSMVSPPLVTQPPGWGERIWNGIAAAGSQIKAGAVRVDQFFGQVNGAVWTGEWLPPDTTSGVEAAWATTKGAGQGAWNIVTGVGSALREMAYMTSDFGNASLELTTAASRFIAVGSSLAT